MVRANFFNVDEAGVQYVLWWSYADDRFLRIATAYIGRGHKLHAVESRYLAHGDGSHGYTRCGRSGPLRHVIATIHGTICASCDRMMKAEPKVIGDD